MIYYLKLVSVCFKTIILYLSLITKHCLALCIQNVYEDGTYDLYSTYEQQFCVTLAS